MLISDRERMGPDPIERAVEVLKELEARPDGTGGPEPLSARRQLSRTSPAALQWREKKQSPGQMYRSLVRLQQLLGENRTGLDAPETVSARETPSANPVPLFVNDRADIALALGIHVHLTEASLPTRIVRSLLPRSQLVGRSVHSQESALEAEAEGADYVLFGPIFDTPSKRALGEPQGLEALASLSAVLRVPVVAVGGIGPENLESVFAAGASAWAAIAAAWDVPGEP